MTDSLSKKSIVHNAVFNVLYKLLNILFPLISAGYVARILTPFGVGRAAVAQNNTSYFIVLAMLGIQAYSIREISRLRKNKENADKLFSEIFIINAIMTAFAIIVFFFSVFSFKLFRDDIKLYLICGIVLYTNFFNIDWYFQAVEEYRFIAVRSAVIKLISLLSILIFVHDKNDIYIFALISSLSACGYYLLNVLYARRTVRFSIKGVNLKRHLRSLFMLALCTVSTEIYARLDITMLGIMKGEETVAYYSYSQRIVNLVVSFVIAVTAVFLPRLSFYYSKDKSEFNRLTKFGTDLMIFISFPTCCGIASVAYPTIMVWLGSDYGEVVSCLIVLAFIIPLKCIGDIICYQVMLCAGQEFTLMVVYSLTVMINGICNFFLIPVWGALGACIASLISEIFVFVLVLFFSSKYRSFSIDCRNLIVVTLSSLIMVLVVVFVIGTITNLFLRLIGGTVLGIVVFFSLNIAASNSFLKEEIINRIITRVFVRRGDEHEKD